MQPVISPFFFVRMSNVSVGRISSIVSSEYSLNERDSILSRNFSLLHYVHILCGIRTASYPVVPEGSFPGVEESECEVNE
jgi:hypothetical protein